jgi:type IV secretion system protein VirD4
VHNPTLFIRIWVVFAMIVAVLALGHPIAFIVEHGWNSAAWSPNLPLHPTEWFRYTPNGYINVALIFVTYWEMLNGTSSSFAGGGFAEVAVLASSTIFFGSIILFGGKLIARRDASNMYGSAQWASQRDLKRLDKGLEIGLDPETGRSVRIQVEGNLLTIAPPRTGKTQGFIIPNLVFSEPNAWTGPAVVIDPKGDAYRAVRRHREQQGRTVRCIDPLNFVGGRDRWNPLSRVVPTDILYLQSMAFALLPPIAPDSGNTGYFQSRANDVLVAAILATIRNGRPDPIGAATLLMKPVDFLEALEGCTDQVSMAAREILNMDSRSRDGIISTAQLATQWLRDERMQAIVQDHTFELSDLASGKVDLFIVIPAEPGRKEMLAPYIRWLLADLFESVRQNRPAERIMAFIDEANVLGRFDAILNGAGELPGYGISLWTFWQSRHQMIQTYSASGAEIFIGTAEMINLFNLSAAQPEEKEYWSKAIGTYTGVKGTTGKDARTGRTNESTTPEALRLVPATDLPRFLRRRQVVFLTSTAYTPDPLRLSRTLAYTDARFAGLIDLVAPVGRGE